MACCKECNEWLKVDRCQGRVTGLTWSEEVIERDSCSHPCIEFKGSWKTLKRVPTAVGIGFNILDQAWVICRRCEQELILEPGKLGIPSILCHSCNEDRLGQRNAYKSYRCAHSLCTACEAKLDAHDSSRDCPDCIKRGRRPDYHKLSQQQKSDTSSSDLVMPSLVQAMTNTHEL